MNLAGLVSDLVFIVVGFITVAPIISIVATGFMWYVFASDTRRPRSWLLFTMSIVSTICTLSTLPLAYLSVRRFVLAPPLPTDVVLVLLGLPIMFMELVPIYFALRIVRVRGIPIPTLRRGKKNNGNDEEQRNK